MSKFINPTKVITGPNTRWSYANVWEAKSINGGAPKFSVSLIIPKSDTPRRSRRLRRLLKRLTRRARASSRATAVPFPRSPLSRTRSVTVIQSAPMMKRMQTATSSMRILQWLPVSWTLTAILFSTAARFTAVCTAERQSASMPLIPTATRVSPAV